MAANITKYAHFCVQTAMPFFVGDSVTCNAAKGYRGEKMLSRGMERFLRKKNSLGVCRSRIEGKGRSGKYIVYFD